MLLIYEASIFISVFVAKKEIETEKQNNKQIEKE
jgi:Sec-independent protein secretion pathway component TatC